MNTRDRILHAAARVLSERGYAASRLSDIADLAGLRTPGMYHYFASRDDLVLEVMRTGQQRVWTHVREALDAYADESAALRMLVAVEAHLRIELELSDFATAVTRNLGHVPPAMRKELSVDSDAYHDMWRGLLTDAESEGLLEPGLDLGVARMMIIGALNWTPEWWHRDGSTIDVVVSTAQAMITRGLFGEIDSAVGSSRAN